MPDFFVRIELPEPPEADYEDLHRRMEAANYYRVIESVNGWRHLPHATYTCTADWTKEAVLEEAFRIAIQVHQKPRVLVIQSRGWTSKGLRELS